jgi:subtilase family serine protease
MVSAICPNCHILLVEANSATTASLGTAVDTAVSEGAKYVSNSYGGPESAADPSFDSQYYQHSGVAVTASAGDSGYGVSYPAASQYVTAVGGTALTTAANSRGWTESAWGSSAGGEGTGSGCSADDAKPAWQTDTGCARRTDNDVAADADPNTGVAIYDSYDQNGWLEVGGTSAASPIIASVFAPTAVAAVATCALLRPATTGLPDGVPRTAPPPSPAARPPAIR